MRRDGCAGLVFVAALAAAAAFATDTTDLEGQPIVAIRFERYDVFDTSNPKTSSWPYRWANALHVVSREDFLRSMLLFKEGDPYSSALADESARILRQRRLMNPVVITAREVEGGVEVTVETHDHWTFRGGGNLSVFGNRTSYSLDLEEDNFLGWGKGLSVAFASDVERSTWSYAYFDPNVLSTRLRVNLVHSELSDGTMNQVLIERPFFAVATPWSAGIEGRTATLTEYLYSQSQDVVSGHSDQEIARAWAGIRLPGNGPIARRLLVGWVHRRDLYSDWQWEATGEPYPQPEDLIIEGPSVAFEQIANRYEVVSGFRAWGVQEDVALGPNLEFSTTFSTPTFGGDQRRFPFTGTAHAATRRGSWLLLGDGWFSGRLESSGARDVVAGVQLGASQLGSKGLQLRVMAETSHELALNRQLALGADTGLRGWDPDYFDGTGRAVLNVQWRTLLKKDVLGLFSIGGLVFADAGTTWGPRVGPDTGGLRLDVGVGLLFDLSRLSRNSLLQVSAGVPDDGSGFVVIVSTSTIFSLPGRDQ
jgi:hypothetical protein